MASVEINHLEVNDIFLSVLTSTCEAMLNCSVNYDAPDVEMNSIMPGEITSIMNIEGSLKGKPFKGVFAVSWSEDAYLKMANEMLMEEHTELCEDNIDAGCELVNIIFGNCKPKLVIENYTVNMGIPILVKATNFEVLALKLSPSMITTINSSLGTFYVILSMTMLEDERQAF